MMTRASVLRRLMKATLGGRRCSCGSWDTHEPHKAECPVGAAFAKALETWDWLEEARTFEETIDAGSALAETTYGVGG